MCGFFVALYGGGTVGLLIFFFFLAGAIDRPLQLSFWGPSAVSFSGAVITQLGVTYKNAQVAIWVAFAQVCLSDMKLQSGEYRKFDGSICVGVASVVCRPDVDGICTMYWPCINWMLNPGTSAAREGAIPSVLLIPLDAVDAVCAWKRLRRKLLAVQELSGGTIGSQHSGVLWRKAKYVYATNSILDCGLNITANLFSPSDTLRCDGARPGSPEDPPR